MQTSISSLQVNIKGKESNWLWMGPRGVAAIYFTQRANAVARAPTPRAAPPCQNYDSTGSPCGWLWAQGYNLNCKKIKQFLISSTAIALLRAMCCSHLSLFPWPRTLVFFSFLHTPFSGSDDLTLYAFCIVKSAWKHILFSSPHTISPAVSSITDEMYSETNPFITVSESKPPFSNQSYRDYIWFIIWKGLMKPR